MSFILEALKKSDKKRQTVGAPRLDTVHTSVTLKNHRPFWLPLLLVVLCFTSGLLLWVYRPWQAEEIERPVVLQPQGQGQTIQRSAPAVAPDPGVASAPEQVERRLSAVAEEQKVALPEKRLVPQQERIYQLSELPNAVQQGIPKLHMSLHAYNKSAPDSSMIRVNERILRPGAELAGKYLLEEVTAEGAIFRYQGYRFQISR